VELASRLPDALFLLPLAVGGHVDHRATHEVAAALIAPVAFYEDLPYALDAAAVARRRREVAWPLEARDVDVSRSFATRLQSAAAYTSQIPSLFGSPADLRTTLERHARHAAGHGDGEVGAERAVPVGGLGEEHEGLDVVAVAPPVREVDDDVEGAVAHGWRIRVRNDGPSAR
jgi:LmbE family N-acetylglucosaminyl deacetylase